MERSGGVLTDIVDAGGVLNVIVLLAIIGWLSGRILGVRRGFWRALAAGLIGLAAGECLVFLQFGDVSRFDSLTDVASLGAGFVGYVLMVTMLASIVIEAILRPRASRRYPRIPHPVAWTRRKMAILQRLWQIAAAARRNGLWGSRFASRAKLSSPEGARALRLTFEACGGMFIKFGQIAAGRDDFLPKTITGELAELRSAVKPLPLATVREVMASALGERATTAFEWFDEEPLAAASIGVTHRARLVGGRAVIVKIQRPGVEEVVDRDGRVLLWGARQLERGSDSARRLGISDLAEELLAGVRQELDFTIEAANAAAMRRNRAEDEGVAFPAVIDDLTSRRVLVMDEVPGPPVSDDAAVAAGRVPRKVLADRLLRSFLDQVLRDGVYHADPHPGNILIDGSGTMWFIDFGAVGFIDPITLESLQQLAVGFALRDPGILARSVRRMAGSVGDSLDIPALEFDMGQVLTHVEGGGFGPAAIGQVVGVLKRYRVRVPRALTVLGRAVVTMEGTLRLLSPGYSMSVEGQQMVAARPTQRDPSRIARDELIRALPSLRPLPQVTEDLALQLRSGRFSVNVERFAGEDRRHMDRWIDRLLWATLGMTGLIGSALILISAGLVGNGEIGLYLRVVGFVGLIVSSAMQMRAAARILQRRDPDGLG